MSITGAPVVRDKYTKRKTAPVSPPQAWIGIDTGGTFTDLVLCELSTGRYRYHKVPTVTADPAKGVLDGVAELLQLAELKPQDVAFVVLGTTLATNAVLERKCAPTGLITTRGFGDVLELARQRRPSYFNLDAEKPAPPASRDCRVEVDERVAQDGAVVEPLNEEQVRAAVHTLQQQKLEAVAICMVHSYANAAHEQRALKILQEMWPGAYVCASSHILPEFREYERFATAAVNASLMPVMDRYLQRIEAGVAALGIGVALRVMQSNGGAVTPDAVRRAPINTFFSGPAGGVVGCVGVGNRLAIQDLISFDVGGTSTDVCLISGGEAAKRDLREISGFPVRARTIDLHTIGAGGGSIAWVDEGGLLKVGPQSAGAYPGPAAYGRGGMLPTVTDANVVLGRLNPRALLGGRMPVFPDRASEVIGTNLASKLGVDVVQAAAGIIEIINVNMMGAVRVISIEKGKDPRDAALVAFGGAGPLHAAEVAQAMGIRTVLIPPRPGLLSAIGLLHADVRGDFSVTCLAIVSAENLGSINAGFKQLGERGSSWLAGEACARSKARFQWSIDMRYAGQNYELSLAVPEGSLTRASLNRTLNDFHASHRKLYGYDIPGHAIEAVRLRLAVEVDRGVTPPERHKRVRGCAREAIVERRNVWFPGKGFVATPVYGRDLLPAAQTIRGPAIVEQMDATTVVPPGATMRGDRFGYLRIDIPSPRVARRGR